MLRYLINRILWIIPVLWLVATITFFLMHMAPGSPFLAKSGEKQIPAGLEASFNAKYGLDKPLQVQYITYLKNAVRFDWGVSYQQQDRPVADLIKAQFPVTARIGLYAFLLAIAIGVPLGILAALKQNTWLDYLSLFLATAGYTIPSFVLAIFLMVIFAVKLDLVPVLWTDWRSYILPSTVLGLGAAAFIARLTRASMLEIVRQDFVRTARAKGLHNQTVVWRHIVRNGIIPVVTIMGPALAGLITGSLVIEQVFSVPGIGTLYVDSIYARDYPVIMATTLLYAFFIALGNLVVDLVYGLVDPRIARG